MALSYQRWSENDDKYRNVFPDGEYPALILAINKTLSAPGKFDKTGKPIPQKAMLQLDLLIADENGRERKMKDWIMLEGEMSWKFRHLCDACGQLEQYETDSVELDKLVNRVPIANVKSRNQKDQNGIEVLRNTIADYIKPQKSSVNDFINDDIPI